MITPSFSNLVGTLIMSVGHMHLAHFIVGNGKHGSYAAHIALQTYYEEMSELADALAEHILKSTYLDEYEDVSDYLNNSEPNIPTEPSSIPVIYLENLKLFVNNARMVLFDEKDQPVQSLIDDIINLIEQTLYKLTRLK